MTQPPHEPANGGQPDPFAQPAQMPPQPGYSSPQPQQPPAAYPTQPPQSVPNQYPKNWMGIVSIIAPFAGFVIPFATIAGIVFGHLGLAANKKGEANNRTLALWGTILNYAFTIIGILFWIGYFVFVVWAVSNCDPDPITGECRSNPFEN